MNTPRTEFAQALKAIATERGLDPTVIIETIKQAIIAAYRRDAKDHGDDTEGVEFDVELNPGNGEAKVFSWAEGKPEEKKDVTPPGFGRIAAQTAKQVIHQKIREAEKSTIMDEFTTKIGGLITGLVLRFDGPNVRIDLGRTEGIMPMEERVPTERLNLNQRMTFLLKEIQDGIRGKEIILSRSDAEFVKKLFAREVPEISAGSVEIKNIVREAGVRTKMVVSSNQNGVDPVGSCVGQKGVRVQAVTNELNGERVDIIPFTEDQEELIKNALSPAEGLMVKLSEDTKTAKVMAPEDQLSLAIGRDGQNVRLAAKLTGVRIEVEGVPVEVPEVEEPKEEKSEEVEEVKVEETVAEDVKKVEEKEEVVEEVTVPEVKEEEKVVTAMVEEVPAEEVKEEDKTKDEGSETGNAN
jgi:transcription termination/antitermination protein NusA